jgi:predicted phage-related endonuclease
MSTPIDHVRAHVDILRACKRKQSELNEMVERSRAAVEEALGENEFGTVDGEPAIRWGHQKVNRLNQKALKAERPEIVAEYTEASEQRRFEVL